MTVLTRHVEAYPRYVYGRVRSYILGRYGDNTTYIRCPINVYGRVRSHLVEAGQMTVLTRHAEAGNSNSHGARPVY